MGVGNHGLGTHLSEMWGKLRKYPHRFVLGCSFGSGVSWAFYVSGFRRRWEFRARCNFGIARRGLRWREFSEHNETKIYLKYFGLTRRGLKRQEFRSTIDRDTSLQFCARLEISGEQA